MFNQEPTLATSKLVTFLRFWFVLTLINIAFRTINLHASSLDILLQWQQGMIELSAFVLDTCYVKLSDTMEKILIALGILVCIAATKVVFGQTTEGVITYETKVNVHRTLPPNRQEMRSVIPEFRTSKEQLFFNGSESLYKPVEEEEGEGTFESNGGMVRMRFQMPQNEVYVNQSQSMKILKQEFMGKKFLIEDTLTLTSWKFGAETKEIAGYLCKQATFYNEERKQNITAWYTDKLRLMLGPENYNTLPGTVLQVDINEGERVITAINIEVRSLKKNELKVPSSGTKTTEKEYRKMVDEQMQRMNANGGNVIIR